ncbi:MAG: hypothetical protein MUE73_05045 [Planctomycetes bacterium]|nr:hypothetical protein [Planctomycetota bacterium]
MKPMILATTLLLLLPVPAVAGAPEADEAALAFLSSLGDEPDARVLGTVTLALFHGSMPVGDWTYRVSTVTADGRPGYRLDLTMRLELEGGPRGETVAFAVLTPDLRTIESETRETQTMGEKHHSIVTRSKRSGDRITISRTVDGVAKEWTVDARPGLIESGAEPLLVALLALRGTKAGGMGFVSRQQNWFLPLSVVAEGAGRTEVTAGGYDTLGFRVSTHRFDAQAGEPVLGEDSAPVIDNRLYRSTAEGRPVLFEIDGANLRLEICPESGAPDTPVGTVCALLRAMAAKDREALTALVDWDALFDDWRRKAGAEEVRGMSEAEMAAARERFPADFTAKLVADMNEGQSKALRLMAKPVFWTARETGDGGIVVRMTEAKVRENRALSGFVFHLRRAAERAYQITAFPG